MLRVGIYARVSTLDQQTSPMQMRALRDYAGKREWAVVSQVKDVGSGVSQRVLVWRLDRWGRSVADLVSTLQELTALGVGFVSLTEALDFTTPVGRAMAGLLALFAAFERDILRERVRAGLDHARRQGKRLGRPPTVTHHRAEVQKLLSEGLPKSEIARRLEISRTSVRRLLRPYSKPKRQP
jgi:putative DNA-invertase from lambdoid prophage Rac